MRRNRRLRRGTRPASLPGLNHDPLSRCTLCNTGLELADHPLLDALPPRIRGRGSTVKVCPHCGHLYWEGSHVRRMRTRLASFARRAVR
ncbi:MAG: Mut7-C RNAse domain-containing protein [Rhodoplanes sp.]